MYFYAVMYTINSDFLGSGANYSEDKIVLKGLTEAEINQFEGEINRIDALGFNPTEDPELEGLTIVELTAIADTLIEQEPNEWLAVLSKAQGRWLYANHPGFMPTTTEI